MSTRKAPRSALLVVSALAASFLAGRGALALTTPGACLLFTRGDASGDGKVNISDPVFTLHFLFRGGPPPPLLDAADANGDRRLDVSDAMFTLNFLFRRGPAPPPPPLDCPCDGGRPCRLTMRYTGEGCAASRHSQDPEKVSCAGDPSGAPEVFIQASDREGPGDGRARIWFEGPVRLGETFDVDSALGGRDKLRTRTFVHVFDRPDGELLQSTGFRTNCSEDLRLGDQFGSLLLEAAGAEGECLPGGQPSTDLCRRGRKPRILSLEYTGDGCGASRHSQDPDKVVCSGDPAGASPVFVRASDKDDPDHESARVWFEGTVEIGEIFEADAARADRDKLQSKTFVHVFGAASGELLQSVEFRTGCSEPLRIGDRFGSLVLRGFVAERD